MNIVIVAFDIKNHQAPLLERMCKVITDEPIEIYDIKSFDHDINKEDIVIVYGKKANKYLDNKEYKMKIQLPELKKLDATSGNAKDRKLAHNKLLALKNTLLSNAQENKIEESCTLSKETVEALSLLDLNEVTTFSGITNDNKTITCSDKLDKQSDINLSLKELENIVALIKYLNIKELKIVYKSSPTTNRNITE